MKSKELYCNYEYYENDQFWVGYCEKLKTWAISDQKKKKENFENIKKDKEYLYFFQIFYVKKRKLNPFWSQGRLKRNNYLLILEI